MNEIVAFLQTTDEIANATVLNSSRWLPAGSFLFSGDADDLRMIWGPDGTPLWAHGESLMIVGPPGKGKSTLAQRLTFARIGLGAGALEYPVVDDGGRVLYLAMDRPNQVKRSMIRMVQPDDLATLNERMIVWRGPLPVDITLEANRDWLADAADEEGVTTIVVDSLKDIVTRASDEEKSGGYNMARQECLARGIEWVEIHHNRKSGTDNKKPRHLDDVYGSRMLTAGAGSVVSLWAPDESLDLEFTQLKSLAETHRPLKLKLDGPAGDFDVSESEAWMDTLMLAGPEGLSVTEVVVAFYGSEYTPAQYETLKKKLQRRADNGALEAFGERKDRRYRIPVRGKTK